MDETRHSTQWEAEAVQYGAQVDLVSDIKLPEGSMFFILFFLFLSSIHSFFFFTVCSCKADGC